MEGTGGAPDRQAEQVDDAPSDVADGGEPIKFKYPQLAGRRQVAPLPTPMQDPPLLPFNELHPEVLERVAAETVYRRREHLTVQFYGRRGQKQHGLDIVERLPNGTTTLYQVKRYQQITAAQLRAWVEEYAGEPRPPGHQMPARRFDPKRFVIVTSATIDDDTEKVDDVHELQREYHGDLEIVVWGAEQLSHELRDAPGLVIAVFGTAWASAFCGVTADQKPGQPRALGLVEAPVDVLNLSSLVDDAQLKEGADPSAAAGLYATVADELAAGGFPGHAAVMRERQADALAAAGDGAGAFEISYRLTRDRVLRGGELRVSPMSPRAEAAKAAGGTAPDRWLLLELAAEWAEQGSRDLNGAVRALQRLAEAADPDLGQLACSVLEGALIDGLFDFDPPHSLFVDTDNATPAVLATLRGLAEVAWPVDPVVRARLRCAVADAGLTIASAPDDVEREYRRHIDDALAGRLLHAGGLVVSRAARAFAVAGAADRAENLWRQAVLADSEQGLYGDAANALRSTRMVLGDTGVIPMSDLQLVVQAMPNQRRLVEMQGDVALGAFEAAQADRLPDAFGSVRRWLWEARVAGHLLDERLAWRLLGDVLVAGGRRAAAVECYVRVGEVAKAAEVADELHQAADTWRWRVSAQRPVRAAAVKVAGTQSRLMPDADIADFAEDLLRLAGGLWTSPAWGGSPELEAVEALARLGPRIPAGAVDGIRALARLTVERPTRVDSEIVSLLLETYWAVEDRRPDLAGDLELMLRRPNPPHDLWALLQRLPSGWEPLLPTVQDLANTGKPGAADTLAAWRQVDEGVQLTARRACASLLRRPVGHVRNGGSVGTTETWTAKLLVSLLDAADPVPVDAVALMPSASPTVGGVSVAVATAAEAPVAAAAVTDAGDDLAPDVDEAARLAAGPRDELVGAVAEKLLVLAEDTNDIAGSRQQAIAALGMLVDRLSPAVAAEASRRLLEIHDNPGLTQIDKWEVETNDPLSRTRIDTGASTLAPAALFAGADFLRRVGTAVGDISQLASRIIAATLPLLRDNGRTAELAAGAVVRVAAADPSLGHYATSLLFHADPVVRAFGARHAVVDDSILSALAADPAVGVRVAVASRGDALPAAARAALAADADIRVRHSLERAR